MPNFITRGTFERISAEMRQITDVEIPRISKAKQLAAEEGDLSENAEYLACREKLEFLHSQFENLKHRIADPSFIDDLRIPATNVSVGTVVEIEDLNHSGKTKYTILGSADVDLEKGIISYSSPVAKGMIGKKVGDVVDIQVPDGTKKFSILSIKHFKKV